MSSKINLKKTVSYIIPPIITVGLCYVLYSGVNLREIIAEARFCNVGFVAAFLGLNIVAMVARALRWRLQLQAINASPTVAQMSRSIFGTYAVNLVFPRLGEFWRCSYAARICSKPFSEVFGTMVADRLSDTLVVGLLSLLTFMACHAALGQFMAEANLSTDILASWPAMVAYALLLLAVLYLIFGRGKVADKVRGFAVRTWRGFVVIFSMPHRLQWLLFTLLIWGGYLGGMWMSMLAYPPTAGLVAGGGLQCVIVTFVFGSLAMAIPSNGGIGPWQFAVIISLSKIYGLNAAQALTFATLNLGATTLLTILLGLYTFIHIAITKK